MGSLSVAEIRTLQVADINHVSDDIYFRGCSKRCEYCFNPEIQEFHIGDNMLLSDIMNKLSNVEWVCLMGGEPLEQNMLELERLVDNLRYNKGKKVVLFTSYSNPEEFIEVDHYHVHLNCIDPPRRAHRNTSYGYVSYNLTEEKIKHKLRNVSKDVPIYVKTCYGWEDFSKPTVDGLYIKSLGYKHVYVDQRLQL